MEKRPRKEYFTKWTDDELVQIVWDYRISDGACTLGEIVKATGMSKSALADRINRLIAQGRLTASSVVGSLRATDERMMQELDGGRLIERTAPQRRSAAS